MVLKGIKGEETEHNSKRVQNSEPIEYTYMSRASLSTDRKRTGF